MNTHPIAMWLGPRLGAPQGLLPAACAAVPRARNSTARPDGPALPQHALAGVL